MHVCLYLQVIATCNKNNDHAFVVPLKAINLGNGSSCNNDNNNQQLYGDRDGSSKRCQSVAQHCGCVVPNELPPQSSLLHAPVTTRPVQQDSIQRYDRAQCQHSLLGFSVANSCCLQQRSATVHVTPHRSWLVGMPPDTDLKKCLARKAADCLGVRVRSGESKSTCIMPKR